MEGKGKTYNTRVEGNTKEEKCLVLLFNFLCILSEKAMLLWDPLR